MDRAIVVLIVMAAVTARATYTQGEFDCAITTSGYYCHWESSAQQSNEYYYVHCASTSSKPIVFAMSCPVMTVCYESSPGLVDCSYPKLVGVDARRITETPSTIPPSAIAQTIPGGISKDAAPMLVYFSIDDSLTNQVYDWSIELFRSKLKNPNNCPLTATYNVIEKYTEFTKVKQLYKYNMEMASHSISHRVPTTWWESATKEQWKAEIVGMRTILKQKAGVSPTDVRGMRTPFLVLGGSNQFDMLNENSFTYDATMVTRGEPLWPFKLTSAVADTNNCTQDKGCPQKAYPNLWEVPLNTLTGCKGQHDTTAWSMVDACRPENYNQALAYLRHNFYRHYNHKARPPFGLNMHFAWFTYPVYHHNFLAMKDFLEEILHLGNVWVLSSYQVIQWMESPTTHADMKNGSFAPVNC